MADTLQHVTGMPRTSSPERHDPHERDLSKIEEKPRLAQAPPPSGENSPSHMSVDKKDAPGQTSQNVSPRFPLPYTPTPELSAALRRAHELPPTLNLRKMSKDDLTRLQADCLDDVSVLIKEYLYQKRRKIKKTQTMKNSLMKVTALYKEKFHNVIKSRDIAHLDTIIEEYLNLDEINNQLLFGDKNSPSKDTKDKDKQQEVYPVNHSTVTSLAYNQRLLSQEVKQAIDKEVRANDDFKMIKMHGIHYCNVELEEFEKQLSAKFDQLEGKFPSRRATAPSQAKKPVLRRPLTVTL